MYLLVIKLNFQWWCLWQNTWFTYPEWKQVSLWGNEQNELLVMNIENVCSYRESRSNLCLWRWKVNIIKSESMPLEIRSRKWKEALWWKGAWEWWLCKLIFLPINKLIIFVPSYNVKPFLFFLRAFPTLWLDFWCL